MLTPHQTRSQAKAGCGGLQRQLRDLTRDLAAANAAPSLEPLASALATGREGLLDDAGQVAAALAELGPLLARARGALAVREGGGEWGPGACWECVKQGPAVHTVWRRLARSHMQRAHITFPFYRSCRRQGAVRLGRGRGRAAAHHRGAGRHRRLGRPAAGARLEPHHERVIWDHKMI